MPKSRSLLSRALGVVAASAAFSAGPTVLAHDTSVQMVCILSGQQEVPEVASAARGVGRFVVDLLNNTMEYRIVFTGLSSAETVAHFHGPADAGVGGPPVFTLPAGSLKIGTWSYPQEMEADILAGRIYVNVHSANFGGGEIRGQVVHMVADLDGTQEVPSNASTAKGFALFVLDHVHNQVNYYIKHNVANETNAHIHGYSNFTASSPPVHQLALGAVKTGTWAYPEGDEQKVLDGLTYVNIHSAAFGGGEIRGQVVGAASPVDPKQEPGTVTSSAGGIGLYAIDRANDRLGFYVRYSGLTSAETASHIHGYAPPGVNAGVKFALPAGSPKLGVWNYPAADETNIKLNLAYVNIHTANFGGGEIRSQIWFPADPLCPADRNDDGFVSGDDFDIYVAEFESGDPNADFNFDGFTSGDDFDLFVASFESGC